jgi:hypothetical protein
LEAVEGVGKTTGYHFFYRQRVIKPALIGLITTQVAFRRA